jgi:hypothetical protein
MSSGRGSRAASSGLRERREERICWAGGAVVLRLEVTGLGFYVLEGPGVRRIRSTARAMAAVVRACFPSVDAGRILDYGRRIGR